MTAKAASAPRSVFAFGVCRVPAHARDPDRHHHCRVVDLGRVRHRFARNLLLLQHLRRLYVHDALLCDRGAAADDGDYHRRDGPVLSVHHVVWHADFLVTAGDDGQSLDLRLAGCLVAGPAGRHAQRLDHGCVWRTIAGRHHRHPILLAWRGAGGNRRARHVAAAHARHVFLRAVCRAALRPHPHADGLDDADRHCGMDPAQPHKLWRPCLSDRRQPRERPLDGY